MGYTHVRHYHGGIDDWEESGAPVESALTPIASIAPAEDESVSATDVLVAGRTSLTARFHLHGFQFGDALANFVDRQSTPRLFSVWLGLALLFGGISWIAGLLPPFGR